MEAFNLLPNLQLLAGTANIEKQDVLPGEWIAKAFPTHEKRITYAAENDLEGLPMDMSGFLEFFEGRKKRLRSRLLEALGAAPSDVGRAE